MEKKKILNLYAGIGGNRKLWGDEYDITAVEWKEDIANIYKDLFPNDKVVIGDAHQYLLDHYKEFDFIWSSPPCPTHSRMNFLTNVQEDKGKKLKYPDMSLYQEIVFLKTWFKGKWCVENVISYYEPLIVPIESGNHYFWTNFYFKPHKNQKRGILRRGDSKEYRGQRLDINLKRFNLSKTLERKVLNNCVEPELGLHILRESEKELYINLFK